MNNHTKVKTIAFQMAFLMEHQAISKDLESYAAELLPYDANAARNSADYLLGAADALMLFIKALKEKGPTQT